MLSGILSLPAAAQSPGLTLSKSFLGGTAVAGGTVTLQFELSLAESAPGASTAISFTDDLDAAMAGLVAVGLPASNVCGAGSVISGTNLLSFSGGSLAQGGLCSFSVLLTVPAGAVPGTYTNTTSGVAALLDGNAIQAPPAEADLFVSPLSFSKSFTNDPAIAGGSVTLSFTISNETPDLTAAGLTFSDNLGAVLAGLAATGLPANDVCGAGSLLSGTDTLTMSGGTLPPGASCTFAVTLDVPAGAATGEYPNLTSALTGTLNSSPVSVPRATDTLSIIEPLSFSKEFLDDPATPGGQVSLRFTLSNADPARPVTGVAFTDDLASVLPGLSATGLPASDVCGAGSLLSGTTSLSFTGGTVAAGSSCSFTVLLQVPAGAAGGSYANVTSALTGTIDGASTQAPPATDTLRLASVTFSKSFSDLAEPGGTVGLSFTLVNSDTTSSLALLSFEDDLDAVLPGLSVDSLPAGEPCGAGSTVSGTSTISLAGGFLGPGESCTFLVTLRLPAAVADGTYVNTTTPVSSAGQPAGLPAVASLTVRSRAAAVPGTTGLGLILLGLGISLAGFGLIAARTMRPG